ncbi:2TM domain-containing protein [Maribacter litopenaei]|uniref:2TM domain-containing protein n=1 Tax=Maribacter litopenaei TaxID=2976127 RepID=A0ABY5Y437_9FLAO|nr:2TM domain-containing protein [Maribacter litopenaei]UWX53753.1 2TM domain-containing protein [Maribacter litopenaei]
MDRQENKLERAKERLKELKGFYWHAVVYVGVNSFISISSIIGRMNSGANFTDVLDFGTFAVWVFWGIGLFFHGMKVFSRNPIFSKRWEERQIQKYMEKDRQEAEKFK